MRTVELFPGIPSSALGFGCAPILGAVDGKTAKRAIDCAVDHGITHFDLARSYGYGEAERFVGKLLKKRRQQLVLASKFGIQANWRAELLKPIKPLVRLIRSTNRPTGSTQVPTDTIRSMANRFHDRVPLRSTVMKKNVERSLVALQTDHLDYLFVHEPETGLIYVDELMDGAQQLKDEGKIRAFGLAYMNDQKPLHTPYLNRFDVLQFDRPQSKPVYEELVRERSSASNIFFSALRGGEPNRSPLEKLKEMFEQFPSSVILCSMFNEDHIRANATVAQ